MTYESDLLLRFPKSRPELPEAYKAIYVDHYRMNREGASAATSVAQRMESWMHRKVAADVADPRAASTTLEIGAGSLNHLPYEPRVQNYDVVEPFSELFEKSPHRARIGHVYRDIDEIRGSSYDRVVSIAAFEHLADLPAIVAKCGALLAPGGQLRIAIPSEGTLLWGLGWRLTTGVEFRLRHGLDYGVLMRHEHLNTATEIATVLRYFFESVKSKCFGVHPALSFYQFFECRRPNASRCADLKR